MTRAWSWISYILQRYRVKPIYILYRADVVGYEEGKEEVSSKLLCGYPRFVYHKVK